MHCRPANVNVHKVDLNAQMLSSGRSKMRGQDQKLRSIQGMIARTAVPIVKALDKVAPRAKKDKLGPVLDAIVDSLVLLGQANDGILTYGRENACEGVLRQFLSACMASKEPSALLFGDDLP